MTPATGARPARELLARAASRQSVPPGDGRSGAAFERVTGDHVHRPYLAWQAGIMDRAPGCLDHTVVAMEVEGADGDAVLTMLMHDVGSFLVPSGDTVVPSGQHAGFIAHMAALSAAFWEWDDDIGLTTMAQRLRIFAPDNIAGELTADEVPAPIAAAAAGWTALPRRSPLLAHAAQLVHDRPEVITGPLARTPRTFVHGDWKMGNLGTHPDGRTILLDWALPGSGPACWDLCWYLALNRARLPEPKEAAIARFQAELETRGISTGGWWQPQLDLCMIGIVATFGWEKALGDAGELKWWEDAVARAAARRGIPVGPASR